MSNQKGPSLQSTLQGKSFCVPLMEFINNERIIPGDHFYQKPRIFKIFDLDVQVAKLKQQTYILL